MIRRLIDLVLLVLGAEAGVLCVRHARTGRGPAPRALAGSLGAGLFLLLALRAQAGGRSAATVGALLALAGGAHLHDLRQRLDDGGG